MGYLALFFISFFAATILPVSSELTLFGMLAMDSYSSVLLLLFASLGNILGSCVNWYLGIHFIKFKNKKWFPFSDKQIKKSSFSIPFTVSLATCSTVNKPSFING